MLSVNAYPEDNNDTAFYKIQIPELPELFGKDLFSSINDLSILRDDDVRYFISLYLNGGKTFLDTAFMRSERYISIVQDIIRKNDMPEEIALLPLLESAYNPYAVSRSKAVGLWQIVGITSKHLGLSVNRWIDERRDIEISTEAAVRHLKNLYATFGSWDLALAAYNGGAGYIRRAMLKTKTTNLNDLKKTKKLRKETSEYVARFAAISVIYKNKSLFDFQNSNSDVYITDQFSFSAPVNLLYLSKATGIPMDVIRIYNPELKNNITPPYLKNYTLRLPLDIIEKIDNGEIILNIPKYKKIVRHVVKKGECISTISKKYNTKPNIIISFNELTYSGRIKSGSELYIPIE